MTGCDAKIIIKNCNMKNLGLLVTVQYDFDYNAEISIMYSYFTLKLVSSKENVNSWHNLAINCKFL